MARVSPDTSNIFKINLKFTHFGGYFYLDPYINTFSHTHLVGAGTSDYGTLGIMPITLRKNADI
jgi:putative alpha-1,2-mannosidase